MRHFGWEPKEASRLKDGCGDTVSIAAEDGYLTVEEGRLRVGAWNVCVCLCVLGCWAGGRAGGCV